MRTTETYANGGHARPLSSRINSPQRLFAMRSSPYLTLGGVSLAGRLLRCVRHRLNLFTSEEQPNSVGQLLKFVSGDGHNLGAEAKPPTDVNLDRLNFAVSALVDLNH